MFGLLAKVMPREETFFQMFVAQAENVHAAAKALAEVFENYADVPEKVAHIKELEHKGDAIIHDLVTRLNQTFLTPFDREDIHELASKVDDVLDLIDAAASRLVIYRVDRMRPRVVELAQIIPRTTELMLDAMRRLEKQNDVLKYCVEISRMEKKADGVSRTLIAQLFDEETDPKEIIKWKELVEVLEETTDKCEDVANVIEAVALKNA
jgi:uncharacterized protein